MNGAREEPVAEAPPGKNLVRLHLGCGMTAPPGWVNVDGSWNARLAKHPFLRRALAALHLLSPEKAAVPWNPNIVIHDIRKPLPFPAGSVGAIYASHVVEHLYLDESERLLRECFRVLAGGGILRVVVPDLNAIVREYLGERPFGELSQDFEIMPRADRLNQRLLMRTPSPPTGNLFYRIYDSWQDFHSHKWMYDADSLAAHLESAGFADVRQKELHASRIEGIEEVEHPSRVENGQGICLEGIKPSSTLVVKP